jgi:hypothetical protein
MNTILTIILSVLLTVFVAGVYVVTDNSSAFGGQMFYGASISPSADVSEGYAIEHVTTKMSVDNAAGRSDALAAISISPSRDVSEGSLVERPAGTGMYFTSSDHPCALDGLYGLSITPTDPSEGSFITGEC